MRARAWIDLLWRWALFVAYRAMLVYWFVRRPSEPSAHVAVWYRGRLMITFSSYRRYASLPAGGVRRGESAVDAACRELAEEVGIRVSPASLRHVASISSRQQFKEDRAEVFEWHPAELPRWTIDRREITEARFEAPESVLGLEIADVLRRYLEERTGWVRR